MPPRGLQVHLTDLEGNELADSLVMANLGYFQLQSGPGSYLFGMRDGRGKEIYEDWATPVAVTKFSPTTLFPRFDRRPGSERKDVLEGNLPRRKMGGPSFISSFTSK
jgi:UDP-glucose:glycoprotein glucosyltransferase